MTPFITTFTGRHLNPLAPALEDIDILDIAHALALVPRFAGHTRVPISIAQHSVYVSMLCPRYPLQGLLHDASEAYLGDVTKWLKMSPEFDLYRTAEYRVHETIYRALDCPREAVFFEPPGSEIDQADRLMVRYEAEQMLPGHQFPPGYPRITVEERHRVGHWTPWYWEDAERMFIERFDALRAVQRLRSETGLPAASAPPAGV